MRPLVAHCHAGLARLARRTGATDEHFTTAMTMYRDLDMGYWAERLSAEMDK